MLSPHFLLSLHLPVPQAHVCPAGTGPCAKQVTRAQAAAFALGRDVVTHTSTHPARADPCPKSLPQLLDLQTLPAVLACQISACSSWHPSASASAQGSAPLSFQVGTRTGLGPGWLWWVPREAGCQPGWPQGGPGEGSWGCPTEQESMGLCHPCPSWAPLFPQIFTCFCAGGWSGASACILLSPLPTMGLALSPSPDNSPSCLVLLFPLVPCPRTLGPGSQCKPARSLPTPNSPKPPGACERKPQHGSAQGTSIPGLWVPLRDAPGMQVLLCWD